MEVVCINCPMGCRITVTQKDGEITGISGNSCNRGAVYARQEVTAPVRMITAVMPVQGRKLPLSVKTRQAVPKEKMMDCMQAIRAHSVSAPVRQGEVVLANICNTGVDVIATRTVL